MKMEILNPGNLSDKKTAGVPEKNKTEKITYRRYPGAMAEEPFELLDYEKVTSAPDKRKTGSEKIFLVEPLARESIPMGRPNKAINNPRKSADKVAQLEDLYKDLQGTSREMLNIRSKEELIFKVNDMFDLLTDVLRNVGLNWNLVDLSKDKQSMFVMDLGGGNRADECNRLLKKISREVNVLEKMYDADALKKQVAKIFVDMAFVLSINDIRNPKEYWKVIRQVTDERKKDKLEENMAEINALLSSFYVGSGSREN